MFGFHFTFLLMLLHTFFSGFFVVFSGAIFVRPLEKGYCFLLFQVFSVTHQPMLLCLSKNWIFNVLMDCSLRSFSKNFFQLYICHIFANSHSNVYVYFSYIIFANCEVCDFLTNTFSSSINQFWFTIRVFNRFRKLRCCNL